MSKPTPLAAICDICNVNFVAHPISREVDPGIEEWGFECPQCKAWTHAYFINGELQGLQETLATKSREYRSRPSPHRKADVKSMQRLFQKRFREFNETQRVARGINRPLPDPV